MKAGIYCRVTPKLLAQRPVFYTELADCYGQSNIQGGLKSTLTRAEQRARLLGICDIFIKLPSNA